MELERDVTEVLAQGKAMEEMMEGGDRGRSQGVSQSSAQTKAHSGTDGRRSRTGGDPGGAEETEEDYSLRDNINLHTWSDLAGSGSGSVGFWLVIYAYCECSAGLGSGMKNGLSWDSWMDKPAQTRLALTLSLPWAQALGP